MGPAEEKFDLRIKNSGEFDEFYRKERKWRLTHRHMEGERKIITLKWRNKENRKKKDRKEGS